MQFLALVVPVATRLYFYDANNMESMSDENCLRPRDFL